ncbi:ferritin subunit [Copidosoma floridanum]|uniref:ferritin subunit n=1 Tax=Copidosoma floridanum TaxID=29053 RepID=UPI0006C9B474|nr:ferritin subunit [Copidosoma floridanum]XP_014218256.1 ferritin subunit [Copidosoma floridanum]
MIKVLITLTIGCLLLGVSSADENLKCTIASGSDNFPQKWKTMVPPCIKKLREQVVTEVTAAMTYLAMGANFATDTLNRPGFSEFFIKSASEEREHSIKIMEYLLMRGELTNDVSKLLSSVPRVPRQKWNTGEEALTDALNLEHEVTTRIRDIIKTCEDNEFNDYHVVDYLTGDFLTEQYEGQRDLAGKLSTLGKMMVSQKGLGEFLFDKMLLNKEI